MLKELYFNLKENFVSFMSIELAGCPKNSRRWTRVVAAPKFSAKNSCSDDTSVTKEAFQAKRNSN